MRFEATVLSAAAATGAVAQSSSSTTFPTMAASNASSVTPMAVTPMVVTMTIDDCSSSVPATIITVTNGVTVTYCPTCDEMSKSSVSASSVTKPAQPPAEASHTTVYTTYYQSLCTTGSTWYTTPVTYTVTESCTDAKPTWASASDYVPPGFTTTVMDCHKCAGGSEATPVPVTVTMPCDCTHTGFYADATTTPAQGGSSPTGPAPAGNTVSQISDGQVQAPGPSPTKAVVSQISDGQVQAPASSGPAPAGSDTTTTVKCPGGTACHAEPTGAPVSQISDGQVQAPAPSGSAPAGTGSDATTTAKCPGGTACHAGSTGASDSTKPAGSSGPAASTSMAVFTGRASRALSSSWIATLGGMTAIFIGGLAVML